MSILDFTAYKEKKELKYLDDQYPQPIKPPDFANEMDSIAQAMEMSTDELMGELTIRVDNDHGIREISTDHIVDELTQRLLAIEYVLFLTMAKNTKK